MQLFRMMRGISSSGMQPQSMRHGHIRAYHSAPCIVFQTERISCVAASLLAAISADGRWAILFWSVAVLRLCIINLYPAGQVYLVPLLSWMYLHTRIGMRDVPVPLDHQFKIWLEI